MAIHSASIHISASYSNVMLRTEPSKQEIPEEQLKNAVPEKLDCLELSREEALKRLYGVEVKETADSDGTVTQSISGGVNILGPNVQGLSRFQVSISFRSSEYQPGQLGSTVDLLTAAHQVQQNALQDRFSGVELEQQTARMEELYQQRKEETASSFADMVGGTPEGTRKMYSSVQALFTAFEARYQAVTASSGQDSWMDASLWTATLKLQKMGASIPADTSKQEGFYTLREMEFAALGSRGSFHVQA